MDLIITILPVVTKNLPISPRFTPYNFLSRCKFSTLTTRQPMVEFYLLTFPRFPLRKKEHKSYFGKNRTHDFRTSRCAGCLLDHSGDEGLERINESTHFITHRITHRVLFFPILSTWFGATTRVLALVAGSSYDGIRLADSRDIPGITEIITPLEEKG